MVLTMLERLRYWYETYERGYILAVRSNQSVFTARPYRVPSVRSLKRLPRSAWHRSSAGEGAKGLRWYDWAHLPLSSLLPPGERSLIVRQYSIRSPVCCCRP
jgi:hypothetical protein